MFGIERYESLLGNLIDTGLEPSTSWGGQLGLNTLLLRHDVDFSVDFAHQLALVEHRLKICSTYFFMLTSNMYNLLSSENQRMVKDIAVMGHKISIHFDPTVYEDLDSFRYEKNLFEETFGREIDIVSIHRPGPFLDRNNISLCGIQQTYQDLFFKDMKYISDSGGRDVLPSIAEYLEGPRKRGLHFLIHPIWWVSQLHDVTTTLNNWRGQNMNFITSEIRANCTTYKD
jgi:hypothetical protein